MLLFLKACVIAAMKKVLESRYQTPYVYTAAATIGV